jgi:outer membrane protein assembly factor BamB
MVSGASAEWTTARGNAQRTGNLDGLAGPTKPKVLWSLRAPEQFISPPVPVGQRMFIGGLGAFNTGTLHCLALDDAPNRELWAKAAPFIKRPTVCSPVVAGGLVIFGDGMHQTDDAILYALHAETGQPVWQLPLPGRLIHMEGSPTVDNGRVFIGAGDGGVVCVELAKTVLDGQERTVDEIRRILAQRWQELQAKYEADKQKDPEFAVGPSDDSLPKPSPKLLWQAGKGAWHVDSPTLVAGNKLLVASAYLDDDKCGKRAMICAAVADGKVLWETPLDVNPWAGPTLAGDLAIVGCSTIRYDPKQLDKARGQVLAVGLADGKVRWKIELPGGVLGPVAVAKGLAVCTATDGKVRAIGADDGQVKWTADCGLPLFAGPAIAAAAVYVADLKGNLHALNLADGKKLWSLNVPADPTVGAGEVYGSPAVQAGRIYLATCNLDRNPAESPSAVVCIADESAAAPAKASGDITVDEKARTVSLPCWIAPRKLPTLKDVYPIEVMATFPAPQGQKAHETIVTFQVKPSDVHKALERLGLKPGAPARGDGPPATGPEVLIFLELPVTGGMTQRLPIEAALIDRRTQRPMPRLRWLFTGSVRKRPDPDRPVTVYAADLSGTLISLFPVTDECVFQSDLTMVEGGLLKLDTNTALLPPQGAPAKLIIQPASATGAQPAGPARPAEPRTMPYGALPSATAQPAATPADGIMPATADTWLPPAQPHERPAALPVPFSTARPGQLTTLPPLPPPDSTGGPSRPTLPAEPAAAAESPVFFDLAAVTDPVSPAIAAMPQVDGDPDVAVAHQATLAVQPAGRTAMATWLVLTVPAPFAQIEAIRLTRAIPDTDAPAREGDLLLRTTLPDSGTK